MNSLPRLLSNFFLPPFVLVYGVFASMTISGGFSSVAAASAIVLIFGVVLPMALFFLLMKLGKIDDQDTRKNEQRRIPYLAGIMLMSSGCLLSFSYGLETPVILLWAIFALGNVVLLVASYFYKVSAHLLFLTGTMLHLAFFSPAVLLALPVVPLIGWARHRLGCHTPAELLAGALYGSAIALAVNIAQRFL